jgi:maltose 6'-phosphate phosphatase
MRSLLVLLGLCGSLSSCSDPSADPADASPDTDAPPALDAHPDGGSGDALRFATVNLRCLLDEWPTRVELLAEQIAAVDPDLLALQEVCRVPDEEDALPQLLSRLEAATGRSYGFVRTETHLSWDQYQEGIAVVSPHEIRDEQVVHLPAGAFPRSMVAARVQTPLGEILFASTHLCFGEDQASVRAAQLEAARAALESMRATGEPVALAGDFNEEPDGAAIGEALAAGYVDSWAEVHPTVAGATFPASAPSARIDYLLLLADAGAAQVSLAEVFLDQPLGAVYPSDHLGLRVHLKTQ